MADFFDGLVNDAKSKFAPKGKPLSATAVAANVVREQEIDAFVSEVIEPHLALRAERLDETLNLVTESSPLHRHAILTGMFNAKEIQVSVEMGWEKTGMINVHVVSRATGHRRCPWTAIWSWDEFQQSKVKLHIALLREVDKCIADAIGKAHNS